MNAPNPASARRTVTAPDRGEVLRAIISSADSHGAAQLAARLAERLSLRLALIHVQVPIPPPDAAILEGPQPISPVAVDLVLSPDRLDPPAAETADWEQALVSSEPTRRDTIIGRPAETLRRVSDARHTRLLVVVDDGGPLSSKFSGNAARDVIRGAGCPVVLVATGPMPQRASVRNILCGVDENDNASDVAMLAAALTERLGGRLRFVHVRPRPVPGRRRNTSSSTPSTRTGAARLRQHSMPAGQRSAIACSRTTQLSRGTRRTTCSARAGADHHRATHPRRGRRTSMTGSAFIAGRCNAP